jgi:hypothetical protein
VLPEIMVDQSVKDRFVLALYAFRYRKGTQMLK